MTEKMILISDYSRTPSGRHPSDGPHNGQEFREKYLIPALRTAGKVAVKVDGVAGLPDSFVEEAFGGLVRSGFAKADLRERLIIIAETPRMVRYPSLIWSAIEKATQDEHILDRAI